MNARGSSTLLPYLSNFQYFLVSPDQGFSQLANHGYRQHIWGVQQWPEVHSAPPTVLLLASAKNIIKVASLPYSASSIPGTIFTSRSWLILHQYKFYSFLLGNTQVKRMWPSVVIMLFVGYVNKMKRNYMLTRTTI